eukprot:scaffold38791_cov258-Isochrysis_galbana.AAC.4
MYLLTAMRKPSLSSTKTSREPCTVSVLAKGGHRRRFVGVASSSAAAAACNTALMDVAGGGIAFFFTIKMLWVRWRSPPSPSIANRRGEPALAAVVVRIGPRGDPECQGPAGHG